MKHIKLYKYFLFAIVIALGALIFVAAILFFFPPNARHRSSKSLDDYGRFIQESSPLACVMFPDSELLTKDNCVFYDQYRFDGSNTPQYLTYALCSFSEEVFNREVSRLADLASEYAETYFDKPAFILYLNYVGSSEYALIDKDSKTIHYVSCCSERFYDHLPAEDKIKPAFAELTVIYKDIDLYYDQYK